MTMPTGEELRELLELAAKAAGYRFRFGDEWHDGEPQIAREYRGNVDWDSWEPHEDDSRRLEVAAQIKIEHCICHPNGNQGWVSAESMSRPCKSVTVLVQNENDRLQATRVAVLRCAAEVGRAMGEDNE